MSCVLWNPQSLCNKIEDFIAKMEDEDIDAAAVVETWMVSQKNNITAMLREAGYKMQHFNRESQRGGGVALIYRAEYDCVKTKCLNFTSFECLLVTIGGQSKAGITFVIIYRLGKLPTTLFLEEIYSFIEDVQRNFNFYILCGDFNLHYNREFNIDTQKFCDILSTFSLKQSVVGPTQKCGNTLDFILHDPTKVTVYDLNVDFNTRSDHAQIFFKVLFNVKTQKTKNICYKDTKNVDMNLFRSDMADRVANYLLSDDVDFKAGLGRFYDMCIDSVDTHVKSKSVTINVNPRPKWMDHDFLSARRQRRKLYKIWRRSNDDNDKQQFIESRNLTQSLSVSKRKEYFASSISNCENSQKELFNVCKTLLDTQKCSKLPTHEDPLELANKFNDYFVEKITDIRSKFTDNNTKYKPFKPFGGANMHSFSQVTGPELKKLLLSKPIKTSADDPLPAVLLKACMDEVLPAFTYLVNLSLTSGSMEGLKDSVVTPLLKKSSLDAEVLSNYRPVTNIPYISKSIERSALYQFNAHMLREGLHVDNQSSYKVGYSCETLLLRLSNDIIKALDYAICTILLLLDLSAAFDTVDHDILLEMLREEIGVDGNVYKWFESFLRFRSQVVSIDGKRSSRRGNSYGVPQGSVVGPVLFNIYVRNLIKVIEEAGYKVYGYADDHQVVHSFRIEFQVGAVRNSIPRCLELIAKWMDKHFLKLNPGKSQVIIFHPKSVSSDIAFSRVMLGGGSYIGISKKVNNLGVIFDSDMSFSSQISSIVSQGYQLIRNVSTVRKYLSVDHIRTLINCMIVAKIDSCNSLLFGVSSYELGRLQRFQNSCARLIYGKHKYDHVTNLFHELHWLPVKSRIIFKIICIVFKCLQHTAPVYLSSLINYRRQSEKILVVPRCKSKIGENAFDVCGPSLWNALPCRIRLITSFPSFKAQLKHHLFSNFQEFHSSLTRYRT